jgi:hypothetical protein
MINFRAEAFCVMTVESLTKSELWQAFERQARRERKQPAAVLARLMLEYLEIAEDVRLNEELRRDAHTSGFAESDAVRLVKARRAAKRRRAA